MTIRTAGPVLIAILVSAVIGACSSDDFSGVGGGLPTDVSQDADSIEVALMPIYPTQAIVITPLDTIPGTERPALYIGERPEGAWRGTPLIQFETTAEIFDEKVPLGWDDVNGVKLSMIRMAQYDSVSVERSVKAYELLAPMTPDDLLVSDVTTLLGDSLGVAEWNKDGDAEIALPKDVVQGWFESGMHNGIAVVHEGPEAPELIYSNFRGISGMDFPSRSRLDISSGDPFTEPILGFDLLSGTGTQDAEIPATAAWGHIERDLPSDQDIQIGSYIERRLWVDFDLGPETVPVDATINSGTLILQLRQDLSMQVRGFSTFGSLELIIDQVVSAWESTRDEAGDVEGVPEAWRRGNRELIGVKTEFNPDPGRPDGVEVVELRLDITEYVQRQVNEIWPDDLPEGSTVQDVGLLIAFTQEQLDLCLAVFYGLDQADDLKPRLEITYTPPADSWQ